MTRDTQPVRRVQARAHQATGGAVWIGPAIGLIVGLCGLIGFGLLIALRPAPAASEANRPTAILATITPSPVVPTPTPRPSATPSPGPLPSATPEGLYVGGIAMVSGTGSVLRLRSDPGLQTTTLKTIEDGTRLQILEGPRDADGLTWWRLRDLSDGAEGWAAQDYLLPSN
jgi:hypothetical protein